jgi:Ca2+-binding EF-hand superfamily protein
MFTKIAVAAVLLFSSSIALAQMREGSLLENSDADHDGKITRQEFLDSRAEQAAKLFDRFDANHDGVLDAAEQEGARNAAGRLRGRRAQ